MAIGPPRSRKEGSAGQWLRNEGAGYVDALRAIGGALKALPRDGHRSLRSGWPEVVRSAEEAYGWNATVMRIRPTAAEVDKVDRLLAQVYAMPAGVTIVTMGLAVGARWKDILRVYVRKGFRGGYREMRQDAKDGILWILHHDPTLLKVGDNS